MKDLQRKEHYRYKKYTLLMKSSAYIPSIENTPMWIPPSIPLLQFFKNLIHPLNRGGFTRWRSTHYFDRLYDFSATTFPRMSKFLSSYNYILENAECFPLTFDLFGCNSRGKRHLFPLGSF